MRHIWVLVLIFISAAACAGESIQPCDEMISVVRNQHVKYGALSDHQLLDETGHRRIFYRLLLEDRPISRAEIDSLLSDKIELQNALGALSTAGRSDRVSLLLKAGVSPNETAENGAPLLVIAAACHRTSTVKVLLDAGANVQQHDRQNIDAMASAVIENLDQLADLLLSYGYKAKVDSPSGDKTLRLAKKLHNGKFYKAIAIRSR